MAELRAIRRHDAPELAAIHALSFDRAWSADEIDRLIATGAEGWRAEDGFVLLRAIAGEAEVLTLAVAPAARRQGLARRLVDQARTLAAQAIFLEVAVDNAPAIGLYEQAGFDRVGLRRGYYARSGGAVDALVMRLPLKP